MDRPSISFLYIYQNVKNYILAHALTQRSCNIVRIFGYSGAIQLKLAFVAQLEGCITKMDS